VAEQVLESCSTIPKADAKRCGTVNSVADRAPELCSNTPKAEQPAIISNVLLEHWGALRRQLDDYSRRQEVLLALALGQESPAKALEAARARSDATDHCSTQPVSFGDFPGVPSSTRSTIRGGATSRRSSADPRPHPLFGGIDAAGLMAGQSPGRASTAELRAAWTGSIDGSSMATDEIRARPNALGAVRPTNERVSIRTVRTLRSDGEQQGDRRDSWSWCLQAGTGALIADQLKAKAGGLGPLAPYKTMSTLRVGSGLPCHLAYARHWCVWMARVEGSMCFEFLCTLLILANTTVLAYETEFDMTRPHEPMPGYLAALEIVFTCAYSVEIVVRMSAQGCKFFYCSECGWNWFDLALVCSAISELIFSAFGTTGAQSMSYLRIMRLLKMLKVLRVVRLMRQFRELRLVLSSLMGSLKSCFWSIILVIAITFMFSLCLMQGVADHVHGNGDGNSTQAHLESGSPSPNNILLLEHWGSLAMSMLCLFKVGTGGLDWELVLDPLWPVGGLFVSIFILFIAFYCFVIVNSITSIFVEGVRDYAEKDQGQVIYDQLQRKEEYMNRIVALYQQMDEEGSGDVSFETFCKHLSDPSMVAFAESLDIDCMNLKQFFNILSANGARQVDLETFVVGCIKLRGMAKSMDMMDVLISQRRFAEEIESLWCSCDHHFKDIRMRLALTPQDTTPLRSFAAASPSSDTTSVACSRCPSRPFLPNVIE